MGQGQVDLLLFGSLGSFVLIRLRVVGIDFIALVITARLPLSALGRDRVCRNGGCHKYFNDKATGECG
jgi:hypothetical protein